MFRLERFSVVGIALGLLFFSASLTPSLIPRGAILQGALGGLVMALGYLVGRIVMMLWRSADMPEFRGALRRYLSWGFVLAVLALFLWTLGQSLAWQNDLRMRMESPLVEGESRLVIVALGFAVFAVCFVMGAILAAFVRLVRTRLYRVMPERRANVLGLFIAVLILVIFTREGPYEALVTGLDESYEAAQNLFDPQRDPPTEPGKTGAAGSLVDWAAMGALGREFVLDGPSAEAIEAFTGQPAKEPIRIYVGRANGDTAEERAALALEEMKRQGAFDRKILVVVSPTGTGWLDPGSHDPLEYMHGGDVATVSVQYSYLLSPLALFLETDAGLDQATALLEVVHEYWKTLPPDARPRLYAHGLSLGAWTSMFATNMFRVVNDPIDGALWAGPPFPSNFWNYVQNARQDGSPWVFPEIHDGSLVRYANHYETPDNASAPWGDMRIVFLQYSSDPIVFYSPSSLWRPPVWMLEPPAPDVSRHLAFMPVVTQFQLALDMALSFGAPAGHGHAYIAQDYIVPWVEVSAPENWTQADTARLKAHCDNGFPNGCTNR